MKNYWKYFGIYITGYFLFLWTMYGAFDISIVGSWRNGFWIGLAYIIANAAGDIERAVRHGDAK